jgi:hypothetical protein
MYKELAKLIKEKAHDVSRSGERIHWRIEGLHIICGERLDLLIEGYVMSYGENIYPDNEEPFFDEHGTEIELELCDAYFTNGDEKFIDLETLKKEIE